MQDGFEAEWEGDSDTVTAPEDTGTESERESSFVHAEDGLQTDCLAVESGFVE